MEYEILKGEQKPAPVLSISLVPNDSEIGGAIAAALPRLLVHIAAHDTQPTGPPIVIYRKGADARTEIEIAVPVEAPLPEIGEIKMTVMPAGPVATTKHVGPYEAIGEAHLALRTWAESHGHQTTGPLWEIYLTDPMSEREPDEYVTDICLHLT